ncbi:MAG: hypothetical protein NC388_04525 [Clostridium sp.]|nr:hypothetical protein [Clostridium sp.]
MIEYKLLKSEMTGDVYPQQVVHHTFTTDDLYDRLVKRFGSVAVAVLGDAVELIARNLAEGGTVTLDGLGTFSLRLGMGKSGMKDFDDVRSQDIMVSGVRFNACRGLRERVAAQERHLQRGDKVRHGITAVDRWVMIYAYVCDLHACRSVPVDEITLTSRTYQSVTGCTAYTARKELEQLCREGKLRAIPAGCYKVYALSRELGDRLMSGEREHLTGL